MKILGIETSCDETAVSIIEGNPGKTPRQPQCTVLSHLVASQIATHAPWGGVVPSLAKREHLANLPPLVDQALKQTNLRLEDINLIAVTYGPGLEPALWVGFNFAHELAARLQVPCIPVNHMEGHILSVLTQPETQVNFPALALLISGGHTELVLMKEWLHYEIVGQTRDDAVGEAFDKVARLLGLPYPGGPEISKLAAQHTATEKPLYPLPRPMIASKDLNFSFSGLKTAVLYLIKKIEPLDQEKKIAIAHEFQQAAIDVLLKKTLQAITQHQPQTLIIGGGVVANQELVKQFREKINIPLLVPELKLSTDNATMIAIAGYCHYLKRDWQPKTKVEGNLKL